MPSLSRLIIVPALSSTEYTYSVVPAVTVIDSRAFTRPVIEVISPFATFTMTSFVSSPTKFAPLTVMDGVPFFSLPVVMRESEGVVCDSFTVPEYSLPFWNVSVPFAPAV